MTYEEVEKGTFLKAVVGSRALGLEHEESDTDVMGICIEPMKDAYGLDAPFEQFVRTGRSAAKQQAQEAEPLGPDTEREGPDLQIYGLRKFLRLAISGNPTIIALLFIPPERMIQCDARGYQLRELTPYILSRQAGKAFLGYMQAQRQRLLGERGQKGVRRKDLEEKYGYDTKYAMHILRLGMQGVDLLTTGTLQFPLVDAQRSYLLNVRGGGLSLQQVLTDAGELEAKLKDLLDNSPLPEKPNRGPVERWMLEAYINRWSADAFDRDLKKMHANIQRDEEKRNG